METIHDEAKTGKKFLAINPAFTSLRHVSAPYDERTILFEVTQSVIQLRSMTRLAGSEPTGWIYPDNNLAELVKPCVRNGS